MTSKKAPRRERNKLDKRARIQAAATRLFSERGFDATTTKAIADEAGVAAGTVFLYAEDKADLLLLAMCGELARVVEERFASLPPPPLVDQLVHVFGGFLSFYEAHPKLAIAFVQTVITSHGRNAEEMDRLTIGTLQRFAALIEAAQARGELQRDVPPLLLAQNCFAIYFSALSAWLRRFAATMDEALGMLRLALSLQLRGLQR